MIEKGHVHKLVPTTVYDRPDGSRVVKSRCETVQPTPGNTTPGCSLEEERVFSPNTEGGHACTAVKYRVGGLWFAPLDLLRVGSGMPVAECPDCEGGRMLVPCGRCGGLGVISLATDGMLEMPNLNVRA